MNGAESYFHKYGIVSLLVGRFIGPLRPMLPMVAGMCDMPIPRFIGVSLLAGAGWSVAYLQLVDPDPAVRLAAVRLLGETGEPLARTRLENLLQPGVEAHNTSATNFFYMAIAVGDYPMPGQQFCGY